MNAPSLTAMKRQTDWCCLAERPRLRIGRSLLLAAWSALLLPNLPFAAIAAAASERPNVIVILTDDQGYGDVGLHGNRQLQTPQIGCFAKQGLELTRFYCNQVCAPTRASLLTGRYYYRTGVIHTSRGGAKMHGDELTLAELLGAAGYQTGIFGKWHLGDNAPMRPQDQGFAESLVHRSGGIGQTPDQPNSYFDAWLYQNGKRIQAQGYCTDVFFDAAMSFIEQHRDEPFFVYLPTNAPHTPLEVSHAWADPYRRLGLDETTARVYGMVANIDHNLGRLLERLDRLKLRERTLVVFLGDNGPQQKRWTGGLRGRKGTVYEGGIRVPCFVQYPARVPGGRQLAFPAAHIDLLPTILSLCNVQPRDAPALDGLDLTNWLTSKEPPAGPDRLLFFQCHRGLEPRRYQNCAVIGERYKLLGYPGTFSREDLQPAAEPVLELYDLLADAGETHNLAADHPQTVAGMRKAYEQWFDDVRSTRHFKPGVIAINDQHRSVHLCRYQDCTYVDGKPIGWQVRIAQEGRYSVNVQRAQEEAAGAIFVRWQDKTQSGSVAYREARASFDLSAGEGLLEIWFTPQGGDRRLIADNSTLGDATIRLLPTPRRDR